MAAHNHLKHHLTTSKWDRCSKIIKKHSKQCKDREIDRQTDRQTDRPKKEGKPAPKYDESVHK